MLFTSPVFLFIFLPIVLLFYKLLSRKIFFSNLFLLAASSFFYYYGEQNKLFLMYFVIILNWATALAVNSGSLEDATFKEKSPIQKLALYGCILICIGLLWYYKYLNFTIDILNNTLFTNAPINHFRDIVLPLGISFYTFHVLSYTLDVYFGRLKVEKNLFNFASYVLMFPQLIAGPIVRYKDIKYQFYNRTVSTTGFLNGIRIFCYGFAKKVLVANTISVYVDEIFSKGVSSLSTLDCWFGAIGYSLQIYFDFSGYSSMAIGLAMLFGFHYKENFNYPYISKSASEFWRRWHISLSTWLRDYVYINMGGNRVASWRRHINVVFVFLCSGLWHGANFTFVCWGLLYGICIMLENMGLKKILNKFSLLAHCYLLIVAITGWVIFRADSMNHAMQYIHNMYVPSGFTMTVSLENNVVFAFIIGIILSYDWRNLYKKTIAKIASTKNYRLIFTTEKVLGYILSVLLFIISLASVVSSSHNPFIYFRF